MAAAVVVAGSAAALYYGHAGLTLSHYDARAHLVVARRVIDSLTPSWQQIGAVWLPLPHLLNMLPVQVDAWYRTGASAVVISILSMGLAAWALASVIQNTTGSTIGAAAAAALLISNPNVLYLQSTPMTEPLLLGTTMAAIALTSRWILDERRPEWPVAAGVAMAAACLTRYEAWPVTAATIAIAGAVLLRRGTGLGEATVACARLAAYPAAAIALFLVNSRWTVGAWFVSGGFFVPENVEALGHPLVAWEQVRGGLYRLSGTALVWSGYAGAVLVVIAFIRSKARAPLLLVLALVAAAALPWYAYMQGHPFRIRYDAPLVGACAALAGAGIGLLWSRVRSFAAVALVAAAMWQSPALDRTALLVVEAQRDAANMAGRRAVTAYLVRHYDGGTILMSMGSLAHYMQDLSVQGLQIRDFLHEGNGVLWSAAVLDPRSIVGWVVVEERAEGGDVLYAASKRNPRLLEGFNRVAEGGGVALYRAR